MKKQFIVIGQDILGNVVWGAGPTLKEASVFVRTNGGGEDVNVYLYLGKGKVKVKSCTKNFINAEYPDDNGITILLGKGFSLTNLATLE